MAYKEGVKVKSVPLTEEYQRELELLAKLNDVTPTQMLKFLVEDAINSRMHDYDQVNAKEADTTNL